MDYKKLIIELVDGSADNELLELVYRFCSRILRKGQVADNERTDYGTVGESNE